MAFLVRKPFIFIIIGIICLVLIIQFSGVLTSKPTLVILPSLSPEKIPMNQNATLTVVIENKDTQPHLAEYRIVGTFSYDQIRFYDKVNGTLLNAFQTDNNYTIIYPLTWNMNTGEQRTISVLVEGLDPKSESAKYTIFIEVWSDKALSERKHISLTVTRT